MKHSGLQFAIQALWIGQMALLFFLGLILVTRRVWKNFPVFTAYALFNLLNWPIQFFLSKSLNTYVYSYIVAESISVLLGVAVVYEIFVNLFSNQIALRKLATFLLAITVVLLVGLASSLIYTRAPGVKNYFSAIMVSEQAARALELGLLMFLFICSGTFGLHWRQPLFGIAIGLGFYVTVQLSMVVAWTYLKTGGHLIPSLVGTLAFDLSLIVWIGYFLAPERAASMELPERAQLEQWNRAVMELLHQ